MHSTPADIERVIGEIIEAARRVHAAMGPGRAKAAYDACMAHELAQRRVAFAARVPVPVKTGGRALDTGLRIDLLVAERIIVELVALAEVPAVFEAQLKTLLELAGLRVALLINFNAPAIDDGIRRIAR